MGHHLVIQTSNECSSFGCVTTNKYILREQSEHAGQYKFQENTFNRHTISIIQNCDHFHECTHRTLRGRGQGPLYAFTNVVRCIAILRGGLKNQYFFKVLFGREGHKKIIHYSMHALDNVDNSGHTIIVAERKTFSVAEFRD